MALNEAETKFFQSRGTEVDASLSTPEPASAPEGDAAPTESAAATSEPAAAPTPAVPPAAAPAAPPANVESPQVPLAALHEERRRRAEIETERQQLRAQLEQMRSAMQAAQTPQAPDPSEDPMGYLSYQNQQLQAQVQQMAEWRAQQEARSQQEQQYSALTQQVAAAEQAFRAKTPDYDAAAQFALQMEDRRLAAFYPNPTERMQMLRINAANVLSQAVQQGRDPAEMMYAMARNMGYGAPPAAPVQAAAPAPAVAAPAAAAPPAASAAVVETIQKGLKQQTLAAAGGSTPPSEMTPEMLAAISDPAEFNKAWAKFARSARR